MYHFNFTSTSVREGLMHKGMIKMIIIDGDLNVQSHWSINMHSLSPLNTILGKSTQ